MTRPVELRSDTFTRPTESMRRAMYEAEVGDDVWGEDPTVRRLEERAAEMTGMEAGLFVSSGTQGNLIGLLSHTQTGDEVIVGDKAHCFLAEVAGAAVVGGLQMRALANDECGRLAPSAVGDAIRGDDIHYPRTGAVTIENTHNFCGGRVLSRDDMAAVADVAHDAGVPVHLDGARVFNAAVALRTPAAELLQPVDSVTFCLSKGLGAPVGSLLCGSGEYVGRARKWRKLLGGGMRQAGVIAAAGLVALEENVDRLAQDHENARLLAEGLAEIQGIGIDPSTVETNFVLFTVEGTGMSRHEYIERMAQRGVRVAASGDRIRAAVSYEVSRADIDYTLQAVAEVARQAQPALA